MFPKSAFNISVKYFIFLLNVSSVILSLIFLELIYIFIFLSSAVLMSSTTYTHWMKNRTKQFFLISSCHFKPVSCFLRNSEWPFTFTFSTSSWFCRLILCCLISVFQAILSFYWRRFVPLLLFSLVEGFQIKWPELHILSTWMTMKVLKLYRQ